MYIIHVYFYKKPNHPNLWYNCNSAYCAWSCMLKINLAIFTVCLIYHYSTGWARLFSLFARHSPNTFSDQACARYKVLTDSGKWYLTLYEVHVQWEKPRDTRWHNWVVESQNISWIPNICLLFVVGFLAPTHCLLTAVWRNKFSSPWFFF